MFLQVTEDSDEAEDLHTNCNLQNNDASKSDAENGHGVGESDHNNLAIQNPPSSVASLPASQDHQDP